MELSPTAYVILGMLSRQPSSGYDIKSRVDRSTRFFWAASYGQIYPELRRLADAGLVRPESEDAGGRRRTVYTVTEEGQDALEEWLAEPPQAFEIRDEGLLKLFFAAADPASAETTLAAKQRHHESTVERLRKLEADVEPQGFPLTVLRYGIECHTWMADWCERQREEL